MQSLARAYDLLSRDRWLKVPIRELLDAQLAPFASGGGRYVVHGPDMVLTPKVALALGLVWYELATNATKYGALSVAGGHIDICWEIMSDPDSPMLVFRWSEHNGPPVYAPARFGFGSELVKNQLKYEFNGRADMKFLPQGVRVTLSMPVGGEVMDEHADEPAQEDVQRTRESAYRAEHEHRPANQ